MDKAEKINFLSKYQQIKNRIEVLAERRKAYETDIYGIKATTISDMPKSSGRADMGDKIIKLLSLTKDIDTEITLLGNKLEYIKRAIKRLDDLALVSVLEMKYVDGLQRKQISSILGISVIQVDRRTDKALDLLPLLKEDADVILKLPSNLLNDSQ